MREGGQASGIGAVQNSIRALAPDLNEGTREKPLVSRDPACAGARVRDLNEGTREKPLVRGGRRDADAGLIQTSTKGPGRNPWSGSITPSLPGTSTVPQRRDQGETPGQGAARLCRIGEV